MVRKLKIWFMSRILNYYSNLNPKNRKYVNHFFFIYKKNLRTYYTKPKKSKLFKPLNKNFISNLS